MKRLMLSAAALALGLPLRVSAQDLGSQIVGVWQLQKFDRCKAGTDDCTAFYGGRPSGYIVFTKGGLFLSQAYAEKRVVPKTPDPTDEERIALHKSMFAWGGRYKIEGNKTIVDVEISWNQAWTGTVRPGGGFKLDGKTVTLTSPPFKSTVDGSMVTTRLTLTRAE
jgi:hypothetical protein